MSRPKVDWFQRGRDAFTEGKPCQITDARINGQDRQAWHDGYDHQQALNNPMSETDRQELIDFLETLK